jgi:parallel beta-helix repeat protein
MKKITKVVLSCLLLTILVSTSYVNAEIVTLYEKSNLESSKSIGTASNNEAILFVGGNGPDNFTSIQTAINYASPGDTIFVYDDSAPYHENIIVNKTLTIIGENKVTTIVDGDRQYCFFINASNVKITNFTLLNMTEENDGAIWIFQGKNIHITNNIFLNNFHAILADGFPNASQYDGTLIENNTIDNTSYGISIWFSSGITIKNNQIQCKPNEEYGGCAIDLTASKNINVTQNNITAKVAFILFDIYNVTVTHNNLRSDYKVTYYTSYKLFPKIKFDNNYWGKSRILPKFIPGIRFLLLFIISKDYGEHYHYDIPIFFPIPKIILDRHPAQKPFTIPGTRI